MRIKKVGALVVGVLSLFTFGVFALVPQADAQECTLASFDVLGSSATYGTAINNTGQITGRYEDSSGTAHGFVRDSNGGFVTFDPSGSAATSPTGINDTGHIVGSYNNNSGTYHSFLRNPGGGIVTIDVPGSVYTFPQDINSTSTGQIVGYYEDDPSLKYHGFLRNPDGGLETFNAPGGDIYILPMSINNSGQTVGYYNDLSNIYHGFLRIPDGTPNGNFVTIDVPGAAGTYASTIDNNGQIAGWYRDFSGTEHGFLRDTNGGFVTIDVPGSAATHPYGINNAGQIAGDYVDSSFRTSGFVRDSDGSFAMLSPSGNITTFPSAINNAGKVTGYQYDSSFAQFHGLLATCGSSSNQPPTATADTYQATQGQTLTVAAPGVLGNDSDPESAPLTAVLDAGSANGSVTLNTNGSFTYTPTASFTGTTTFTYHASDGTLNSAIATVAIGVAGVCKTTNGKVITGLTSLEDLEKQYPPVPPAATGTAVYFNDRAHADPDNPVVDVKDLQPELRTALANFKQLLGNLPTATSTVTSGYRPAAYQAHLYEINTKRNEIIKSGDLSNPACVDLKAILDDEFRIHKLGGGVSAPGTSQHEVGKAFDITICDVVNGVKTCITHDNMQKDTIDGINIDTLAASSSLNRPCLKGKVKDVVHYSLLKDPVTGKAVSCYQ